ncbi:universal stress protein [Natronomonas sp.]|uniref:universal stress protein n=1 Tax=Natronomonas sp. TaxID=2184060 RepID=UPI002FC33207
MPANVLVPVDGSSQSFAGLVYTLVSFPNATVTALYARDPELVGYPDLDLESRDSDDGLRPPGERVLERAREIASGYQHEVETALEVGRPHRVILAYLDEHDIDHVVMGSHGESPVVRPFLGHVTEAVVRRASVSTTIIPEPQSELLQRTLPGRILVPVDGSEQSLAALEYAIDRFPEGRITVFHAVALPFEYDRDAIEAGLGTIIDGLTRRGERILDSAVQAIADEDLIVETELAHGKPARSIVDYTVENDFDQIIMGRHGRSLPARMVLGSVAETVSRRSEIPVTLVVGHGETS